MKKLIIFLIAINTTSVILKPPMSAEALAKADDDSNPDSLSSSGTPLRSDLQLDSLKNALNNAKHDTSRVRILLQIVENIYDDNVWPEYNLQALDIAKKNIPRSKEGVLLAFKKAKADALNNIGYIRELLRSTFVSLKTERPGLSQQVLSWIQSIGSMITKE